MLLYLAIKYHEDRSNLQEVEALIEALAIAGHEANCMVLNSERFERLSLGPKQLMHAAFREILAADAFVVDISEKGVGLGIEAGFARAANKPIIVIAKRGSDIPETLFGITQHAVVFYSHPSDIAEWFGNFK
jgi:2'-deoxynucleoside 5'-phosphate N-hydrolase